MKSRFYIICGMLLVCLLLPLSLAAQDEMPEHPLFTMLANVPATATIPTEDRPIIEISYVDYRALEQARPGVPSPESWEALNNDANFQLWVANMARVTSGWPYLNQYFRDAANMPEVMGFDLFDIDRTFAFGSPPGAGFIFDGDFDAEAIAAAHNAREYTQSEVEGVTLWCGPVGCDDGTKVDPVNRNLANIFGGDLGRQQPFALVPGHILQSGDLATLNSMIDTHVGKSDSLLDLNEYRAIAEAITEPQDETLDLLVQVQFLLPSNLTGDPLGPDLTPILENYGTLPAYSLAGVVDRQEGEFQVAMLAVAYLTEEDATQAAEELTNRLASFPINVEQPNTLLIEDESISASIDEARVYYSEAADRWVAIAAIRYPLPAETADSDRPAPSGVVYRLWFRAYVTRSFTLLTLDPAGE